MNQADFAEALLRADGVPTGLVAANGSDPLARMAVYRNNRVVTWRAALAAQFPVIHQLLGATFFAGVADEFCRHYPPKTPIFAEYGDVFADFLADFAPVADIPYLADVVRLEYQRVQTGHAADSQGIDPANWAAWLQDPERLTSARLVLQPGLAVLVSDYAVYDIWVAHHHDDVDWAAIDAKKPQSVLIWRQDWRVVVEPVAINTVHAITALQSPMRLGETLTKEFDWQQVLALLLERHLVINVEETC